MTDEQHKVLMNAITEAVLMIGRKLDEQKAILSDIRDHRVPRRDEQPARANGAGPVNLERLSASGHVVSCTRPMKDGEYIKTKKGGVIWNLTLEGATPFKIALFEDKLAQIALDAQRTGKVVIVEYEKSLDGRYDNLRSLKVASQPAGAAAAAKKKDGEDPF